MRKKKDHFHEIAQLTEELRRIRQQCLAANRRGDFRAVARLTCEAARVNRLIAGIEGTQVPALERLGDTLFTSDVTEPPPAPRELALA